MGLNDGEFSFQIVFLVIEGSNEMGVYGGGGLGAAAHRGCQVDGHG